MDDYYARKSEMAARMATAKLSSGMRRYLAVAVELYAHGREAPVVALCRALAMGSVHDRSRNGPFLGFVAWRLALPGEREVSARQALLDCLALARAQAGEIDCVDNALVFVDVTPEQA